jgi:tryptophanyl-tRNA synthetase
MRASGQTDATRYYRGQPVPFHHCENPEPVVTRKRALTGIKPTGVPHIANYIGAIRPGLALTAEYDTYYFIADYHALTVIKDAAELTRLTYEVAAAWLAMGLDPAKSTIYRQSDLPEVFELSWILGCITPKGLMNRAHAYKAAVAEAEAEGKQDVDAGVNMGLFSYPVLMAADILLFSVDAVPVGRDQSQHIEYTRDIARRFNAIYGDVLTIPELVQSPTAASIIGDDGRKMSKSYGNVVPLFADSNTLRKLIRRYKTDSTGAHEPKDPDGSGLFQIHHEIAPAEDTSEVRRALESGEMPWGQLKDIVFELLEAFLKQPRERYRELMADKAQIHRILMEGAERARPEAAALLGRVRHAIGRVEMRG